jgi:hypothetical protein
MDDAFDTLKNHLVRAADADDSDLPERYLCPLCQTEVGRAEGRWISAHFRHRRDTDHEDCERYSRNFHTFVPMSHHEYEHLDAVLVAKITASPNSTDVTFAVRFRPAYSAKSVTFISGKVSNPYAMHSQLRQQYFRIEHPEENYQIRAEASQNRQATHIVDGFGSQPVVFRAAESESVRIPSHRELKPGSYLVCSKTAISSRFHPELQAEPLSTIKGLHAIRIRIPPDPGWQIRANLKTLLDFETASQLAEIAFISPPSVAEFAPDCWEVSKDADITLVIQLSKHLTPTPSRLLIQKRADGRLSSDYLSLPKDSSRTVLTAKAGPGRPDLYRIALADPIRFILEINFSNDIIEPESARVLFQFGVAHNQRLRLTWSSQDLPRQLANATEGKSVLLSVTKPKAVQLSLGDHGGRHAALTDANTVRDVLTFLRTARFPCYLRAPGYPTIMIPRARRRSITIIPSRPAVHGLPTSRRSARLLAAFSRRRASRYSVRTYHNNE